MYHRIYGLVGYDVRLTRGRSPVRFRVDVGGLAQSVECVVSNDEAPGSKPGFSTFFYLFRLKAKYSVFKTNHVKTLWPSG